jgi:hypothetical protein
MTATFYYTDGTVVERVFETPDQCRAFAQAEGDHLDYWEVMEDD